MSLLCTLVASIYSHFHLVSYLYRAAKLLCWLSEKHVTDSTAGTESLSAIHLLSLRKAAHGRLVMPAEGLWSRALGMRMVKKNDFESLRGKN